jgi:hypothetical protein
MPIGFKRANKRRNGDKRATSHQARQRHESDLRTELQNSDSLQCHGVAAPPRFALSQGDRGGLSRALSKAAHRKRTTRQRNPPLDLL